MSESVTKEAVDTSPIIPMPHLPNELIERVIFYAIEEAYPDFLRNIPAPEEDEWGDSELPSGWTLEEWYENYFGVPEDHHLFNQIAPRGRSEVGLGPPRYHDGATALSSTVRALALISRNWLRMTYKAFKHKLSEISATEHALFEQHRCEWHWRDEEAVLREFWFSWKILNSCGYGLARADELVSLKREQSLRQDLLSSEETSQNLRQENDALRMEVKELLTREETSQKVRQENDALRLEMQELQARLKACTHTRDIA